MRDFLTSRRARITPQQAGLPEYGGKRRVPGLRRSELATLAGISVEYLTQLERGNVAKPLSRCWTRSPGRCSSTKPNGRTCSTWRTRQRPAPDLRTRQDDTRAAASLRIEAGRTPNDRQLSDLVGELATRSDAFATRWGKHNVRLHGTAKKGLHNAVVGELELTGDALQLPGEDLTLIVYTAPAGSAAQEKLDFLTRWAGEARPGRAAEVPTGHVPET